MNKREQNVMLLNEKKKYLNYFKELNEQERAEREHLEHMQREKQLHNEVNVLAMSFSAVKRFLFLRKRLELSNGVILGKKSYSVTSVDQAFHKCTKGERKM